MALEIFLIVQNQPPCHKTASTSNDLSKNISASLINLTSDALDAILHICYFCFNPIFDRYGSHDPAKHEQFSGSLR